MTEARCPDCKSPLRVVELDDGTTVEIDWTARGNVLAGLIAVSPRTGVGHVVGPTEIGAALRWQDQGATLHMRHSESCLWAKPHGAEQLQLGG